MKSYRGFQEHLLLLALLALILLVWSLESSAAFSVSGLIKGFSKNRARTNPEAITTDASPWISQKYREASHAIATEFSPTEFRPLPALSNRHIQTIAGVYLRSNDAYKYVKTSRSNTSMKRLDSVLQKGAKSLLRSLTRRASSKEGGPSDADLKRYMDSDPRLGFYDERQRFETPDGDFFDVDFKYQQLQQPSNKGMVVILHGLQSSSHSSLSVDMAIACLNQGFDVACMNFRGCSGEMNRKIGGYHLGFTDDLKQFLEHLKSQRTTISSTSNNKGRPSKNNNPPLFLSGFSMGSNVVLKTLGELGNLAHLDYNIYGAAVSGAPFDQERNVNFVHAPGFNRLVYMNYLLKSLKKRGLEQMELFQGSEEWEKIDVEQLVNAKTIADVENAVVAPIYGFENNVDYYRKTSCQQFLDSITVPTLIINAADDPFYDPSVFPWDKSSDCDRTSPIRIVRTAHGGHLGFMFHQQSDEIQNAEDTSTGKERASWMPTELSRFLHCAFDNREMLDKVSVSLEEIKRVVNLR